MQHSDSLAPFYIAKRRVEGCEGGLWWGCGRWGGWGSVVYCWSASVGLLCWGKEGGVCGSGGRSGGGRGTVCSGSCEIVMIMTQHMASCCSDALTYCLDVDIHLHLHILQHLHHLHLHHLHFFSSSFNIKNSTSTTNTNKPHPLLVLQSPPPPPPLYKQQ